MRGPYVLAAICKLPKYNIFIKFYLPNRCFTLCSLFSRKLQAACCSGKNLVSGAGIGKIVKKHPPLWEAQRVQKSVNPETKKVVRLQNCSRGLDHFSESNFKFQMFSNDILNCKNIKKAVTEKTVKILNLNFKFL